MMSVPIDAELADLLDQAEIVRVIEMAAGQITWLQRQVCELETTVADIRSQLAMLEAVQVPWQDAGQTWGTS